MNAFDVIQMQFRILEIRPLQQNQPQNFASNWKFLAIIFVIILHILMVFSFLTIEATNYDEYSASVFVILTGLISIIFYLSIEYQINRVFKLINDFDNFAVRRKIQQLWLIKITSIKNWKLYSLFRFENSQHEKSLREMRLWNQQTNA